MTESAQIEVAAISPKKILVVEDEDKVRKLTMRRLRSLGHNVLESSNGFEALELYAGHEDIDLVFTDVVMADGMSGFELAERIKAIDENASILFTTGYAEELVQADGIDPGQLRLLHKPYAQKDLERALFEMFSSGGQQPIKPS